LLEPVKKDNANEYNIWNTAFNGVNSQTQFAAGIFPQGGTFFGCWAPLATDSDLRIYAGVNIASMQADKTTPVSVCALLSDDEAVRSSKYEQEWNGFWHFANVMQFLPKFMAATKTGIAKMSYMALTVPTSTPSATAIAVGTDSWDDVYSMLFDDETKAFAKKLEDARLPKPDDYGLELEGDSGEIVATIEMVWTDKKIAFITQDVIDDRATIEAQGWTVITSETELNSDIWGGND
ncbi:MAG: helicase, partial [Bacteroidia bacterium]|nr:helicase [Bacteroidia bacterium]